MTLSIPSSEGNHPMISPLLQKVARTRMRTAIIVTGLTPGVDDDQHMDPPECGIRIGGRWTLCYCEVDTGSFNGMFLIDDKGNEIEVCEGVPTGRVLARRLRRVLDKHELWDELKGK